ncbi:IclR family transcriptional regulator [Amycolatopsis jiangsuensis]|uniref:DNA-binding IclR family transcriptional regulator n=1 Tax=Amycolatopsis jiangsuensis TaxID=1181879 RepID=A0A840J3Y4_9PSEU|nr:IclR family transcriptional regulator C-terminal domain-containing protein [Amycolatopsis jiangsuensis]MBB4688335.1 DNA-binding IclR family transcriptional regulator [Amycolatopsis jiangsuensis]
MPTYPLKSVDHALQVLAVLQTGAAVTVGDVAQLLGIGRSSAHRVLSALVHRDYAEQGVTREYRAGHRLPANPAGRGPLGRLWRSAAPAVKELAEQLNETVFLQVLRGRDVHFVATVEARQAVRVGDRTGLVLPAHMVSGGRAMLATMSDEDVIALYSGSRLGADPRSLRHTLDDVRRKGFGTNVTETRSGFVALGVAVGGTEDHAHSAVSLGVPEFRYVPGRLPEYLTALRRAASEIGAVIAKPPRTARISGDDGRSPSRPTQGRRGE